MRENKIDDFCENISEKINSFLGTSSSKLCSAEDQFTRNNKYNIIAICMIGLVSFVLMFILNVGTPLAADDFNYHYIFAEGSMGITDQRVQSIRDIIVSMKAHYNWTNGRIITHFIVQLVIMIGKPVFNVVNSLVYVLMTVLVYLNCVGKKCRKNSALIFLAINLAVWTFVQQWGITNIWLTGSINYLWATTGRLAALLPFRFYADDGKQNHPVLNAAIMFILGIFAGGTSENMSAVFIGMTVLYMIFFRVKKYKFNPSTITALVGAIPSYLFMLLAPGNWVRVEMLDDERHAFYKRIFHIPGNFILSLSAIFAFIIIAAVLLWVERKSKKYRIGVSVIFILGAIAGAAIMLFSPNFPERAWYGIIVATIIAAGNLLYQFDNLNINYRRVFTLIVAVWSLFCSMQYILSARETAECLQRYNERAAYIEEQKAQGNLDIEIKRIAPEDKHEPLYSLADISFDKDSWQNVSKAQYYEVNTLVRMSDEKEHFISKKENSEETAKLENVG